MYKLILPFRYLLKKRMSYLAFLTVALCVFIVTVVMTVMTGLVSEFKNKNHRFVGDCVVGTKSLVGFAYYEDFVRMLEEADFVEAISPVIKSYALVSPKDKARTVGLEIMGIDSQKHSRVTNFADTLYHRRLNAALVFNPVYDTNLPGCVVGIDLWLSRDIDGNYNHSITPSEIGLNVSCFPLTSRGALSKADTDVINTKTFYFSDTTRSGLAKEDGSLIYISFEQAQLLCGMAADEKRVNAIHIKFAPGVKLNDGCEKVKLLWNNFTAANKDKNKSNLFNTVEVQSWKDYRRSVIAAMEKEQIMLTIMFALVGITVVFIVFVVFYAMINHKSKDIGVLKSIGVSNTGIIQLFCVFAFLISCLGSMVGSFFGWLFLLRMNAIEDMIFKYFNFQLFDKTVYAIGYLPNQLDIKVLTVIILSAVLACLAGAFIPTFKAARLKPAEILQVNQL